MKFANETVLVDKVEILAYTQHKGKISGGRLVSLLPNLAGVFETRVLNLQMVQDFNLEDANITFASQVNDVTLSVRCKFIPSSNFASQREHLEKILSFYMHLLLL